jgi:predicted CoA-binding protein
VKASGKAVVEMDGEGKVSTVLLIGASNKPGRYSNMAMARLTDSGYRVIPVNPFSEIRTGEPTIHSLSCVNERIDTAVVYVRAELLAQDIEQLVRIAPSQVIFNPGTEGSELSHRLAEAGIITRNACVLVLLSTGEFDLKGKTDE